MAAVLPAVDQQFDREPAAKEQTRSNMEYTLAKPTAEEYHAVAALKGAAFAEKNFCCGQCCGEAGVKLRTEAFAEWESSNPAKLDHLRIIRGDSGEIIGACQLQIGDDPGDPELESVGKKRTITRIYLFALPTPLDPPSGWPSRNIAIHWRQRTAPTLGRYSCGCDSVEIVHTPSVILYRPTPST